MRRNGNMMLTAVVPDTGSWEPGSHHVGCLEERLERVIV